MVPLSVVLLYHVRRAYCDEAVPMGYGSDVNSSRLAVGQAIVFRGLPGSSTLLPLRDNRVLIAHPARHIGQHAEVRTHLRDRIFLRVKRGVVPLRQNPA